MNLGNTGDRQSWWKPAPMSYVVATLAAWCVVAGWIGLHSRVTNSDAAGNGMATAFVQGFAEAGLEFTAFLVSLYLICRWRPIRYICVAMLALLGVWMTIIVR